MKRILVIMATFNGEEFLKEQLDSILSQKEVEVVVLIRDDGSTDRTIEILSEYEKEGSIQWYTGPHLNVAKGYYELMKKAVSYDVDYIAFSDQDDVWDNDKLLVATNALDKYNKDLPCLYYCGQRLVDSSLNLIGEHVLNSRRNLKTRFILSDFAGCTGVFNTALLRTVLQYEPNYILMHDTWVLKVCLGVGGKVVVDPECHMQYRQHGHNAVGLGRDLFSYYKQVKQYINVYKVEPQMRELLKGYKNELTEEYFALAEACCNYKHNRESQKLLLDKSKIDFCATGLNLTYKLKVLLRKL